MKELFPFYFSPTPPFFKSLPSRNYEIPGKIKEKKESKKDFWISETDKMVDKRIKYGVAGTVEDSLLL